MSAENITSALPVGYMLQNYRIERALGRGGFGITYLATENITGRKVVIKENYPRGVATRESANYGVRAVDADNKEMFDWALGSFVAEARVLTGLRHPHIVQVLTAFEALGTAYYVMDYIGGNSLSKMRPADITEQRLLDILRPILSALSYIHTLPEMLLHRDIKSDNILITPEGTPVLIDFGAARAVISNKTQTKIGTEGYAPPEQWASGAKRGPWTDLYALGATYYYLLTGKNPPDCHDRLFADPGSDLLANRPDLQARFSRALLTSIDKAFALRPADRWQSAQEWMAAITPAPTNGTRVPTIAEPTPPPAPKISKEVAQAELRQKGISAAEYDSKLFEAAENGKTELVKLLIAAGADVNKEDILGETPLYKATDYGHTECVKLLIAAGADVNKANIWDITPLYWAARKRHTECVKLLLAAPDIDVSSFTPLSLAVIVNDMNKLQSLLATGGEVIVNIPNITGETPLYWAALYGHTECVKLLISAGADVNKADEDGITPLSRAACNGHTECVKLLIAAGADVYRADNDDDTPLHNAALCGHTECVKLLISAGADVNKADEDGETSLLWAAEYGHTECVKLLIAAGADVNKADKDGITPLYWAARKSHTECVKLLIDAGADVNKADKEGETPLYTAADNGRTECVKLLLAAGADVNKAIEEPAPTLKITQQAAQAELQRRGISAGGYDRQLLYAAENGNAELVKLLIAAGADVNKAGICGETPLYRAAKNGHTECAKLLIAAGADVNKADEYGYTPLYWAALKGRTECVKQLIDAGADVNKADEWGHTPLYWATLNGHTECAELLRAAGNTGGIGGFLNRLFS